MDHPDDRSLPTRVAAETTKQQLTVAQEPSAPAPVSMPPDLTPQPDLSDQGEERVPWERYIAALRRYKWLMVAVTIGCTAIAAVSTRFLIPEYTARATIWIETNPVIGGPIRPRGLLKSRAWQELLTTGAVLDSVALELKLYLGVEKPEDRSAFSTFEGGPESRSGRFVLHVDSEAQQFRLETEEGFAIQDGAIGDSVGTDLNFRWQPSSEDLGPSRRIAFSVVSVREASNDIRSRLISQMAKDGNFLQLSLTGTDPQALARTLNAITEQFVAVAAGQKQLQLTVQASTLDEQLQIAARNLQEAEDRLQRYRIETITLPREVSPTPLAAGLQMTQSTVMQNYFDQRVLLSQLEEDIKAVRTTVAGVQNGTLRMDALLGIQRVAQSPDLANALGELSAAEASLRGLRQRFTDQHPQVQDAEQRIVTLRDEIIPSYVTGLLASLETQRVALEAQLAVATQELQQIPVRTITEQRLVREKDAAATLFQTLQDSYEQTKLSLQSAIPDVRLLDPAIAPTFPNGNSAPKIILFGFALGVGLAIALALLLDHVDNRFRYPTQVTDELGLMILGAIPTIRKLKRGGSAPEEASQVVEAFRTIRLGLAHSYGTAGPIMLTVSSPSPGDGKSFVASNLALSFADAGYKTLLVDGDIRRGELHRMFDLDRQPGLLDYLTQDVSFEEVIRMVKPGLSIIPCGTRRHWGPELLSSNSMGELVARFKSEFEVVILDSPPLGAGIDPLILGTTTGNMILVLRSGETDRKLAETKLSQIDRLPIRMLGAVLNSIKTSDGVYKYYSYVYDYTPDDESTSRLPAVINSNGR